MDTTLLYQAREKCDITTTKHKFACRLEVSRCHSASPITSLELQNQKAKHHSEGIN
jgi:hypothetical protein